MQASDFPERIQIQTHSYCNARCIMCAYPDTVGTFKGGFMDEDLFVKIINECSKHQLEKIELFLMNEPLMDKRIADRIRYAKKKNPNTIISLSTNASLLDAGLADKLIYSGLDWITLSVHGVSKEVYEKIMVGLDHDKVFTNINTFLSKLKKSGKQIIVNLVCKEALLSESEQELTKKYWGERGQKIHMGLVNNRAGNVEGYDELVPQSFDVFPHCTRPFWFAGILFNGDVVMCCMDYKREVILGNVKNSLIQDIWKGDKYTKLRDAFTKKDKEGLLLCKKCVMNKVPDKEHLCKI